MLKPRPFNRLRFIRVILYIFTALFYFLTIGEDIYGGSANVGGFILNRCLFYIAEAVLITVLYVRSRKTPEQFNSEYFQKTENVKKAADTCFMMIIIVTVFAVGELIPVVVYLSNDIFHGSANGPLVLLLLTLATSAFYFLVIRKFYRLEEQNELLKPTPKQVDFYAFIRSADDKREDDAELFDREKPVVSDETEAEQEWRKCSACGSENPTQLRQCVFCGRELDSGKDDPDV